MATEDNIPLEEVIKQNPQITPKGFSEEEKQKLTEQVTAPILKEAEARMTGVDGVATLKPVKPLEPITRQEQIEATPEGQMPQRLRPGKATPREAKIQIPTTLPQHGIRSLYTPEERILERATQITGLPPESPANHYIAETLAKGDPFSAESLRRAEEERIELIRAGIIPNSFYEGFAADVADFVDWANPTAVEVVGSLGLGLVSTPLLMSPDPATKALWAGVNFSGGAFFNTVAQQMRIGSGEQVKPMWGEVIASGVANMVPFKTGAGLTGKALVKQGAKEGAITGAVFASTQQGFEKLYGEREDLSALEFLGTTGLGGITGGSLSKIGEVVNIHYKPKTDQAAPLLRKVLQDELKQAKKEVQRSEKKGGVNIKLRKEIETIEAKINKLKPDEEKVLQQAIDTLAEEELKQAEEIGKVAKAFKQTSAAKIFKEIDIGEQVPSTKPKSKEVTKSEQEAEAIVDDFLSGGGVRDVDPTTGKISDKADEVKARLLTDDTEKQRLINSVTKAIATDLEKVKGGRVGRTQYLSKVQNELNRRLGRNPSDEFALVMRASQVTDNAEVADAIEQLGIHMAANGAVMVQGYDDLIKLLDNVDVNDRTVIKEASNAILKLIPQQMAWKAAGAEAGRLLQSRKYTKDILDVQQKEILEGLEGKLVSDIKAAKELTDEEFDEQLKTLGDIAVVKKLIKTIQQADDTAEVHQILVEQQKMFQNTWQTAAKRRLATPYEPDETGLGSKYFKSRDIGGDVAYAHMLSNPVTHAKVLISNTVMAKYHMYAGLIGAKVMEATPDWARNGLTKQQYLEAGQFWARTLSMYGNYSEIANKEAMKVLRGAGDSDLRSHYERVGESAFSMERTGLTGGLGTTVENVGKLVDIPGKSMAAIDVRTRLNMAHAMTRAKAEMDYVKARNEGKNVGEFQDYYNNIVGKIFTENKGKLMTEDQVRRKALLMAKKEGVAAENLASYIDNFVKNNWDKNTSDFVNYVDRNLKEVTFTEEIGEFADPNFLEKGGKHIEAFIKTYPILNVVLNPFMRTGRNIHRQAFASTNMLKTVAVAANKIPGVKSLNVEQIANRLWTKTTKDLESDDPIIAARAKGQQIIGAGILLAAYGLAEGYEDVFEFVGTESQDWRTKMNIKAATGLSEYTLRLGKEGEKVAINLQALEPLNTILSIVADVKTLNNGTVAQREEARDLMQATLLALSNNIANKSYYKNLGEAIKLITHATSDEEAQKTQAFRVLKGLAGTIVPSGLNALNYMSDDVIRENNTLLQVIARRLNGLSKAVPPMRDIFGDILERGFKSKRIGGLGVLIPFGAEAQKGSIKKYVKVDDVTGFRTIDIPKFTRNTIRTELKARLDRKVTKEDVEEEYQKRVAEAAYAVVIELGVTGHFNGGTSKLDGMDLQEIIHPETQQDAFDRWQEIANGLKMDMFNNVSNKGMTMKEAIVALGQGKHRTLDPLGEFPKIKVAPKTLLPEGREQEDDRVNDVRAVLKLYRDAALDQLKEEYPIINEEIEAEESFQESFKAQRTLKEQRDFELSLPEKQFPLEAYKETQVPSKLEEIMLPFRN